MENDLVQLRADTIVSVIDMAKNLTQHLSDEIFNLEEEVKMLRMGRDQLDKKYSAAVELAKELTGCEDLIVALTVLDNRARHKPEPPKSATRGDCEFPQNR